MSRAGSSLAAVSPEPRKRVRSRRKKGARPQVEARGKSRSKTLADAGASCTCGGDARARTETHAQGQTEATTTENGAQAGIQAHLQARERALTHTEADSWTQIHLQPDAELVPPSSHLHVQTREPEQIQTRPARPAQAPLQVPELAQTQGPTNSQEPMQAQAQLQARPSEPQKPLLIPVPQRFSGLAAERRARAAVRAALKLHARKSAPGRLARGRKKPGLAARGGTGRRGPGPARALSLSWGPAEWMLSAALVLTLLGCIGAGVSTRALQAPDPHFTTAVATLRAYETGKTPSERNYFDPAYAIALKQLSLVPDTSAQGPEARRLSSDIKRGIVRLEQSLAERKKQREEAARTEAARRTATRTAQMMDTGMDKGAALRTERHEGN